MAVKSKCRSCGASIVFLRTTKIDPVTGRARMMPTDADSVREGDEAFAAAAGHMSHFATCPNTNQHRRPR